MPRPYSQEFLVDLHSRVPGDLGTELAKLCIEAKLPASYVCQALGISRVTLYKWYRGQQIKHKYVPAIEEFMSGIRNDLGKGKLPATNLVAARQYTDLYVTGKP